MTIADTMMVGREVEYSESLPGGKTRRIVGKVVRIEPAVLYDVTTSTRRAAVRFVIRNRRGKLQTTGAMAASKRHKRPL